MKNQGRETLNIVVVGHVDHGKSTLIGRLLYDTDSLPEGAIDKVKLLSDQKGKNFEYAFLLDAFEEEQEQGITIDTTQLQFATDKRDYVIIDAPGHKEFLKNMISGASDAEAAFLMIDAKEGVKEQSRRHGYILSLLGIKKVYVVINKMDLVDYSKKRYEEIRDEAEVFLGSLGLKPIDYIPVSAFFGENIVKASEKMPWNVTGSILEVMDRIPKEEGKEDKPLRFPIQDVYKFDDRRIIVGRLESGSLNVGDEITIAPGNRRTRVKTIEHWADKDKTNQVLAGMSIGITLEDEFFNKRGEIICKPGQEPMHSNMFKANVFWMGNDRLVQNKSYKLKIGTKEVACDIAAIHQVLDTSNLSHQEDEEGIKKNDVGEVTIRTKELIAFDAFSDFQETGRFVLVDQMNVSGGGIIAGVVDSLKNRPLSTNSPSIVPRPRLVTRDEREKVYGQRGHVIWLTGLPGNGKNEIATKLERRLFDLGHKVYYLDSNNMRFGLSSDLEFTQMDAQEQTRRLAEVARLFADSGMVVIVTSVNRYKEARREAKSIIGEEDYKEILIEAKKEVLESRHPKGITDQAGFYFEKSDYPFISIYIEEARFNSEAKVNELIQFLN